jgi:uncharacterized Zn finger protein
MGKLPALTKADIERWVGSASFERGQGYFRHGYIFNARRQGQTLKAQCLGSQVQPYRVEVTLGSGGIERGNCSCPVGAGGRCKHAAALLLTWLTAPDDFQEVAELDTLLAQRSKTELISLLNKMLARYPDLEMLLERPTPAKAGDQPPLDPDLIRRQVRNAFQQVAGEWGAAYGLAQDLLELVDLGDGYVEQENWRDAATLYEVVIRETLENYGSVEDEEGALHEVVNRCVGGLGECLDAVGDSLQRETILHALFDTYRWDVGYGGIDMGYEAPDIILQHATPGEREMMVKWVQAAMPNGDAWSDNYHRQIYGGLILELEADKLDDETFLRVCRETGRLNDLVNRLLGLGRVNEATTEARQANDFPLLGLAPIFIAHARGDLIEGIVRDRLPRTQDSRLAEWLCARYQERGDLAKALPLQESLFWQHRTTDGYEKVKALAQPLGAWEGLRPKIIARLRSEKQYGLLTQVYLLEDEIDQALETLPLSRSSGQGWWSYGAVGQTLAIQVARAAESRRPRQAIQLYLDEVTQLISARSRGTYAQAATYLLRVRDLYQGLGEMETWQALIRSTREQNRRLPALQDELTKAGL